MEPTPGGTLGLVEDVLALRSQDTPPSLHIHHATEESFYILEGELELVVGTQTVRTGPGTFVMVPIGVAHGFRNPTEQPARFLVTLTPRRFLDCVELPFSGSDEMLLLSAWPHTLLVAAPSGSCLPSSHGAVHCAFMTLPAYRGHTQTYLGEQYRRIRARRRGSGRAKREARRACKHKRA